MTWDPNLLPQVLETFRTGRLALLTELTDIAEDPSKSTRRRRIKELLTRITGEIDQLENALIGEIVGRFPVVYYDGAVLAASSVGVPFVWTEFHIGAVQSFAADTFSDVLRTSAEARTSTARLIRSLSRDRVARTLIAGDTSTQSARGLVKDLAGRVGKVTYSNGARMPIEAYADTLMRTKVNALQNMGTINHAASVGVEWFECVDGTGCGLTSHNDPQGADGLIAPIEIARAYPASHPNCVRQWLPRIDVTNKAEAGSASPLRSAQQVESMRVERERLASEGRLVTGRLSAAERRSRQAARTTRRQRASQ